MAVISKKTALIWVLIIAGAVTLWKFVWKPMEGKEASVSTPTTNSLGSASPSGRAMTEPSTGVVTDPSTVKKMATVNTTYNNPAGSDEVGFLLMMDENGVIVEAITQVLATHEISKARQAAFGAGLGAAIKGKKLSELSAIDRVGGSSLTTAAFNEALPALKAQL